ncbi:hypothetical protein [Peribacillus frigoritolerans]|uniref:hypothetical protein n=1 Tax=Peribacillus frigoritolerans TaxID=450367 RepID=UPI002E1BD144|nr:hypothetical protein [Peribacillus frigoritolerans]MED3845583.1 hypothetical protein [Peribacillus frigoritolerans]
MTEKKTKLPPADDWQARDIETWNVSTYKAFIAAKTKEIYGVDYSPGGGGSKQARYGRENGMLKNAQGKYGNRVLKAFIEICWREYKATEQYRYLTVTFAISYLDRHFAEAVAQVAREARREKVAEELAVDGEELSDWF